MRHTTHKLTPEQKDSLFIKYKDLIYMIFCCNGYMLRKQIRKLFHLLSGRSEKDIEFDIAELILTGFLLQKSINKDTRTQMLYLSKYPKSQFLNKDSRDVAAINWSEQKIFEQIFRIDYIIEKVIPDMRKQDFEISMDNIIAYLNWNGSNLLLSNNQVDMVTFYNHLWNVLAENDHNLTDDFFRDLTIATEEKEAFEAKQLKKDIEPAPCTMKNRRDKEMDSFRSDIDKCKLYYSLKNLASHGFYIESVKHSLISVCIFDATNSLYTKKLYQQASYILLMFQRYLNNYNLHLFVTVYTWDNERATELRDFENTQAYDFYRQEWAEENRKHKIMKDIGILPSNWNSITVNYIGEELYTKYSVHL